MARKDKVFPWQGPDWVGDHIPGARTIFFEKSSHVLFLDEPEKFNEEIIRFMSELT